MLGTLQVFQQFAAIPSNGAAPASALHLTTFATHDTCCDARFHAHYCACLYSQIFRLAATVRDADILSSVLQYTIVFVKTLGGLAKIF